MKPNSFNAAEGALDLPPGKIIFLGGTADLLDESPMALRKVATPATPTGVRLPLAMTAVGDRIWVVQIKGGRRLVRRLMDVGIVEGSEITVISRTESGSVIVALQGCRIGLGAGMAHRVIVTTVEQSVDRSVAHQPPARSQPTRSKPGRSQLTQSQSTQSTSGESTMPATLGALAVGQSGRIVGYEKGGRAYREKLLSMGLTPGTHFTVTRQAPLGDPIEIEVRGFKLSLRKGEAAALKVETVAPGEVRHD